MADPTPDELDTIKEFRQNVIDVLDNDERKSEDFLLRWLRARDMNLVKAEDLLRQSMNWRAENRIDHFLERKFDDFFHKNYPYSIDSVDRCGRPIFSLTYKNSQWDFRKVEEAGKAEDFKAYTAFMFEEVSEKIRQQNRKRKDTGESAVRQYILLVDYTGFSYGQLINFSAISKLLSFATTYESHYPELLYRCIFVNCPSFIGVLMSLIKPLLASKTFQKIDCYGYNREAEWGPILEEMIEEEQLPPDFKDMEITHL